MRLHSPPAYSPPGAKTPFFSVLCIPGYLQHVLPPLSLVCVGERLAALSAVWLNQLSKPVPKFRQHNSAVELIKVFTCLASAHLVEPDARCILGFFGELFVYVFFLKFPLHSHFSKNRFISESENVNRVEASKYCCIKYTIKES